MCEVFKEILIGEMNSHEYTPKKLKQFCKLLMSSQQIDDVILAHYIDAVGSAHNDNLLRYRIYFLAKWLGNYKFIERCGIVTITPDDEYATMF